MYFFVKVRIDVDKMAEFGQKLQAGSIKTHPLSTYCLQDDPTIGLNIWEADDLNGFEKAFAPHRDFYKEIIEVTPVILPDEAMRRLIRQKMV